MLSLIYFLLVLSVLILVHEMGHFFAAKRIGVRVEVFSFGFGPKLFSIKKGDTEYAVSLVPLGGYIKMAGDEPGERLFHKEWEFLTRKVGERFMIIVAGPVCNYILAFLVFSIIYMFGSPTLTAEVGGLLKGYPAEGAGVRIGDKILAINGKSVKYWEDATAIIHKSVQGTLRFSIERGGGGTFEAEIRPVVRKTKDIFGKEQEIALIGIAPSQRIEKVRYSFLASFGMGFKKLMELTALTYKAIFAMLVGRLSFKESMTGPIGIFIITGKAAQLGFIYLLHLVGVLSASLAIFNMVPFPVLDGGHILFLAVEKIRGRALSVRTQEWVTDIGVGLLIFLMVFVFYNDIINFQLLDKAIGAFKK